MVGEGYDKAIELLGISRRNMIKSYFEWFGIDVGWNDPKIQYRNYLADKPLIFLVPGGGHWEELTFGSGGSIDITGKKIGVLGDSLTQAYESTIKGCIEKLGGIPVCKAGNAKPGSDPKLGCTLIVGASFDSYKILDFGTVFAGCEHIITELGTNDIGGASFSTSRLTNGMSAVNSKIKSAGLSVKVHSLGIMPFAFSESGFGKGMSFGGVKKEAQSNGDEETAKKIQSAQSNKCSELGWHFLDPHELSVYNTWHDKSAINAKGSGDGVHIPALVGYEEWFSGILSLAFGSGGGNSPWTKEELDRMRAAGQLPTGVKYDAATGKYYRWVGGGGFKGSPNPAATGDRWLDKYANFRDLGGWSGEGGKVTAYRKVYRSADPIENRITDKVKSLGIKAVLSLRGSYGSERSGEYVNKPSWMTADMIYKNEEISKTRNYSGCLDFIAECLRSNRPVLFHCHSGKDRTGSLAAKLLACCGVSASDQSREGALTGEVVDKNGKQRFSTWHGHYNGGETKISESTFGIKSETINTIKQYFLVSPGSYGGVTGGNISHNLNDYAPQGTSTPESTMNGLVTTFTLATGQRVTMHKKLQSALQAAFVDIKNLQWFEVRDVVGYNYRYVNNGSGAKKLSNHSWGVAIDINGGNSGNPFFDGNCLRTGWDSNVPKRPFKTKKSGGYVSTYNGAYDYRKCIWTWDHPVVKIMANHGFGWGGSYGDTMHFSALNGR